MNNGGDDNDSICHEDCRCIETYDLPDQQRNELAERQLSGDEDLVLQQLQNRLRSDFPLHYRNSATLIRFLRARGFDIDKAERMFRDRMTWVHRFKPHMIRKCDIADYVRSGQLFVHGRDDFGRPVIIYKMRDHVHDERSDPGHGRFWRFVIYFVEKTVRYLLPMPPHDQLVVLLDREDATDQNADMVALKKVIQVADYYPETLGAICVLYPNLLFKLLFPLAKNFIDVNSLRKIHIIKSSRPDGIAHKLASKYHFSQVKRENLLEEHGGTIELDQARRLVRDMSIEHVAYANTVTLSGAKSNSFGEDDEQTPEEFTPSQASVVIDDCLD